MTCSRLDDVIDNAHDLGVCAGLSDHVRQCRECGFVLRVLQEVKDARSTDASARLTDRAMVEIEAMWRADRARAKPWEIGVAGLLGGLTVMTVAVVSGTFGGDGGFVPLATVALAAAVVAGWRESRNVDALEPPFRAGTPA